MGRLILHPIRGGSAGWPSALQNGALEAICGMAGGHGKGTILDSLVSAGVHVFAFDSFPRPRLLLCPDIMHCHESFEHEMVYALVNDEFYWQVEANISIGSINIGIQRVIFDTGTPGLTFDPADMPKVYEAIGGNLVPCDESKLPDIIYTVNTRDSGGKTRPVEIRLRPHMYLRVYSGTGSPSDICTPALIELDVP